jgi:hypothetical protein
MIRRDVLQTVAACALMVAPAARADFLIDVTPTVSQGPNGGLFTYSYLVSNPLTNAFDNDPDLVFDFTVETASNANLTSIVSPLGWVPTYSAGSTQIEWFAFDAAFGILPGQSLTFGFTSVLGPGDQPFSALALNQGGLNVDVAVGTTSGPTVANTAVPAPSGLVLLAVGGLSLLGYATPRPHRRKR